MVFGLNADRDAMTDVDVLAECLVASLHELLDTIPKSGRRTSTRGPAPTTAPAARRAATAGSSSARPRTTKPRAVPAEGSGSQADRAGATSDAPAPPTSSVRPRQVSSSASRGLAGKSRAAPKPKASDPAPPSVGSRSDAPEGSAAGDAS